MAETDAESEARGALARFAASFSVVGVVGALLFFLGSLTPSLIPRTWPYQAVASGLSMICGYAVGTLTGWLFRTLGVRPSWSPRVRSFAWSLFAGVGLGSVVGVMVLSVRWQDELRELFGMPKVEPVYALVVVVAVVIALVVLLLGRAVLWVVRKVGVFLDRWLPAAVAHVLAAVVVVGVLVLLVNGTLVSAAMDALNRAYSAADEGTPAGVTPSAAPQRSGSPQSEVTWESLGRQGRVFVSGGPSQHDLITFAGQRGLDRQVQAPIRVYAGLDSAAESPAAAPSDAAADGSGAPEAEAETELAAAAQLVVDELDRTGAWDREVLVVTTTTGTGWVDPSMADSIELMYGGDTAIAAMQYSYLPSWIGFVVDRATPPAAGKALFDAV